MAIKWFNQVKPRCQKLSEKLSAGAIEQKIAIENSFMDTGREKIHTNEIRHFNQA